MRRIIGSLLLIAGVVFVGSGAAGGAYSGLNLNDVRQGDTIASGTYKPAITKLDGHIQRVATGTTTKTNVNGSVGCGNARIVWDDSPAGSAYRVTKRTSWNAPGDCNFTMTGSIDMLFYDTNGAYVARYNIADGATAESYLIFTGTATTKFNWTYGSFAVGQRDDCAYMIPGGGVWEYAQGGCSV